MDCFKDFIGISGCGAPAYAYIIESVTQPDSGLSINDDLPITLKSIDKTANEDQITFLRVWSDVQDRAIKKFKYRVRSGYLELFGVCDGIDDDWFCQYRAELAMALLYFEGSELMYERAYSERINRYTTIDRGRALELKADFENQFLTELKSALETIDACSNGDLDDDIFNFVETLP